MSKPFDFKGVITALVTPFKNGEVDYKSFDRLIKHQLENGIQGFVVNGTTGESPALSTDEVEELLERAQSLVSGQVPIILGTGTNSTYTTIKKTKKAHKKGADAALVVVPYYNKPPQRGMLAHFKAVAESVNIPFILYNVPGRTVVDMDNETIAKLSELPDVVGVKEASGEITRVHELSTKCTEGFVLLSGDDGTCLDFIRRGGQGVISVVSHVVPELSVKLCKELSAANPASDDDEEKFLSTNDALGGDTNPIPVKEALFQMGIIDSPELRLPLVGMEETARQRLKVSLTQLGVL